MVQDELDEIFVGKNELANKRVMVKIIKPYASIDGEGIISFEEEYYGLSFWKKILIYLVCKKAMKIRGISETEEAGPKEISEKAEISLDSAKNISRERKLRGILKKNKKGYYILNYKLRKVKELLVGNEKK